MTPFLAPHDPFEKRYGPRTFTLGAAKQRGRLSGLKSSLKGKGQRRSLGGMAVHSPLAHSNTVAGHATARPGHIAIKPLARPSPTGAAKMPGMGGALTVPKPKKPKKPKMPKFGFGKSFVARARYLNELLEKATLREITGAPSWQKLGRPLQGSSKTVRAIRQRVPTHQMGIASGKPAPPVVTGVHHIANAGVGHGHYHVTTTHFQPGGKQEKRGETKLLRHHEASKLVFNEMAHGNMVRHNFGLTQRSHND